MLRCEFIDSSKLLVINPTKPDSCSTEDLCQLIACSTEELLKKLHGYGALLFRNFEIKTPEDFEKVALSLFSKTLATEYPGGAPRKKLIEHVWTTTSYSSYLPIPAHTELSYVPRIQPTYIFFYCWKSPEWGGQTPIIDMGSVINDLPASLIDKCRQKAMVYSMLLTEKPQRFLDIRLFQCPWFRKSKTWDKVFSTNKPNLVEKKCLANGQQIRWLKGPQKDLIIETKVKSIVQHPITGEELWAGFSPLFPIWGMAIEALFVTLHQRTFRNFVVLFVLWLVTIIQQIFIYFYNILNYIFPKQKNLQSWFPGSRKQLDVCFEDGTYLSPWEVFLIIKAYWNNATIFNWRDGDILLLDNKRIGHQRLPFQGSKRAICVAFGK
ncbi:MAG: TauD/TfdA family dioxygenase [Rivularia sp. (in: Bacteria)]|nr:TauD/TfdA family dioxygenase [Rivularia sp. MS3]